MIRGERIERFLLLPFSIGCDSDSSIALATADHSGNITGKKGGEEKSKMKKNEGLFRASFSQGLHRLIRHFRSFSHFFVYKGEMGQKMEREMEIGFPTDVKHVTHIGLDGSTTILNNNNKNNNDNNNNNNNNIPMMNSNWENLKATSDQLLSFPSISLHQFELAMAAQSHATGV